MAEQPNEDVTEVVVVAEEGDGARERDDTRAPRKGRPWKERVAFSYDGDVPFAYVPGEVLTSGDGAALELARRVFPDHGLTYDRLDGAIGYLRITDVPDALRLVGELQRAGFVAQPNHVFFAHCGCGCGCHPSEGWGCGCGGGGVTGSPSHASPSHASPSHASPSHASPWGCTETTQYVNPIYAKPSHASGVEHSTALPALEPYISIAQARLDAAAAAPMGASVVVLDTGMAVSTYRPHAMAALGGHVTWTTADGEVPDSDGDHLLDFASGHGTFISGLIQQVAPGSVVTIHRVLSEQGDGDEATISQALHSLPTPPAEGAILSLSFGGYTVDTPGVMASAISYAQSIGYVVVSSAGNDSTCQESWPAAFPEVIAVGAVGPDGPASFTNYGPWVRACAPGVNIVSTFFDKWNGAEVPVDGTDPDDYKGWACWSGTSFSGPVVAARLAREMAATGCTAKEAVARIIDQPGLLRIPGLGTVVNEL